MDVEEGLRFFIENEEPEEGDGLRAYMHWLNTWLRNRDPHQSVLLTYEALKANTHREFKRITRFFNIELSDSEIDEIIKAKDFKRQSGRNPGEEDNKNFVRKGIVGDWKSYFTEEHKIKFKKIAGKFLIDMGYEQNYDW